MIRWLRQMEQIIWPRKLKCLCCDALSRGEWLCPACLESLQSLKLPPWDAGDASMRSVYRYDGAARQLVLLLKGQCVQDAADVLADAMADEARQMELPPDTVLTWVTMPKARRRVRGIDHGRTLCEAVAGQIGLPVCQLLVRSGRMHTQRGLNREARLKNLAGTIACPEKISVPVLLIDDVMTTGATAAACAEVLMKAGAPRVYVLTAARTMLKSSNNDQKG